MGVKIMKKITLCMVIVLLHASICLAVDDVTEWDGNNWRQFDRTMKVMFVTGFMVGSDNIVSHHLISIEGYDKEKAQSLSSKVYSLKDGEKITLSKEETLSLQYEVYFDANQSLMTYVLNGITVGQIMDGLNALYEDFKNRSIQLSDAIYIVKKQIRGAPKEDIEQILLFFRSGKHIEPLDQADTKVVAHAAVEGKLTLNQIPKVGFFVVKDQNGKFVKFILFP
jgi:hypothetical protein